LWSFVHALGLSFKKTALAAEQDRPMVARRRKQWRTYQARIAPERLVFIDETWVKINMAPCAAGERAGRGWWARRPMGVGGR
jgi:hypothetical protein